MPDGDDPKVKAGCGLPNTGCDGVAVAAELKEKTVPDEALVGDANTMDAVLVALEAEDAPKENPVEEEAELNIGDLGVCQLEPNTVDMELEAEPTGFASEEVEEATPKEVAAPELNSLFTEVEELNKELPEEGATFAVNPKGDDADELN